VPKKLFDHISQSGSANLLKAVKDGDVSNTKYTKKFTGNEIIQFFAIKLKISQTKKDRLDESFDALRLNGFLPPIGLQRYHKINAYAHMDLEYLAQILRENFKSALVFGDEFSCDEMVFEFQGKHKSQFFRPPPTVHIPRKPHPNGLLCYSLCTYLQHTHLPYVVDIEPRLHDRSGGAKKAFELFIHRNTIGHLVADADFGDIDLMILCSNKNIKTTLAFSSNSESLWDLAKEDLLSDEWRIFQNKNMVASI
jgi:Transposase IS4